jgi:8-oxo-dGTP diphosphatase
MTEYVAGFMFDTGTYTVALIQKQRPAWQKGRWNAIGGHIEAGESPREAVAREFEEETGVKNSDWKRFAVLEGGDFKVHFFVVLDDAVCRVNTLTDEQVNYYPLDLLPYPLVPNLRWLIELALTNLRGASELHIKEVA